MPTKRRHMIAAFVKNKLVLMGGVGQYREKLDSVDIYDIYTGNLNMQLHNAYFIDIICKTQ